MHPTSNLQPEYSKTRMSGNLVDQIIRLLIHHTSFTSKEVCPPIK